MVALINAFVMLVIITGYEKRSLGVQEMIEDEKTKAEAVTMTLAPMKIMINVYG